MSSSNVTYERKRFDAYEIAPVVEYTMTAATEDTPICERMKDLATAETVAAEFDGSVIWTLYGHREGEGVEAIADSSTLEGAAMLLSSILGTPVEVNEQGATVVRLTAELDVERLRAELGECQNAFDSDQRAIEDNKRLRAELAESERDAVEAAFKQGKAEAERDALRRYWFEDADPRETEYAEQYAAHKGER